MTSHSNMEGRNVEKNYNHVVDPCSCKASGNIELKNRYDECPWDYLAKSNSDSGGEDLPQELDIGYDYHSACASTADYLLKLSSEPLDVGVKLANCYLGEMKEMYNRFFREKHGQHYKMYEREVAK